MTKVGFQEGLLRLQEKLLVSEGKTTTTKTVKMKKICSSLPPDLVVRRRGTLLLGECVESLKEACAGRSCWAAQGGGRKRGETPSHSLWREAGEGEREEMQPGLGWYEVKGSIHLIMKEVREVGGCPDLVKETAAVKSMDFHPWHFLSLKAEVSAFPIDRSHMEPLQQLPGQHQRPHSEQETESARKAVQGPEGPVWHLWGRAES